MREAWVPLEVSCPVRGKLVFEGVATYLEAISKFRAIAKVVPKIRVPEIIGAVV